MLQDQKSILRQRGICIVIPTYNNQDAVGGVVKKTQLFCDDIIVVNDGSDDNTASVLEKIEGITLIQYPKNKGKGYALKKGFQKALELGFAYAITIDADGQHNPEDIEKFLNANISHPGTLIVGERKKDNIHRPKSSDFANKFANFWFCLQTLKYITDTQSGFRLYPLKKLVGLSLLANRYEAELELMVLASWHGVKIITIPVDVFYPELEQRVTHFRPVIDFLRIFCLNCCLCLIAAVYALPLMILRGIGTVLKNVYAATTSVISTFCVILPLAWIYVRLGGKDNPKTKTKLHKLMMRTARFVMIHHGIPDTTFTSVVDESVDFNKPHVIICNHQSHIDLFAQMVFSYKMVFLTNKRVRSNPFYGFIIRSADFYPVTDGMEELLPKLKDLVAMGYSIALYPEGTRSENGEISRFHQGAFYLAEQLNVDVLPMMLYGTAKVLPKHGRRLRKGNIFVKVNQPISLNDLKQMGNHAQQAKIMKTQYMEEYSRISNIIDQYA